MRCCMVVLMLAWLVSPAVAAADKKAKTYEVEEIKNVAYNTAKDADDVRHKLDMYLPKGAKNYPVFFFIHGGGWRNGSKDRFSGHGKTFASHGIAFVAVNYRLSPKVKHPEHIKDVAMAFAFARADLAKRGADIKQIFVSGHSAGGHLAALLATDESYLKAYKLSLKDIKGSIPISGVFVVGGSRQSAVFGEDGKAASPQTHVAKDRPPFLVFYGDKELGNLGKQAEAFGAAMKKAGAKIEVKMIKDRTHGTIMSKIAGADDEATVAIFAFIRGKDKTKD